MHRICLFVLAIWGTPLAKAQSSAVSEIESYLKENQRRPSLNSVRQLIGASSTQKEKSITEAQLFDLVENQADIPTLQGIKLSVDRSRLQTSLFEEKFAFQLELSSSHSEDQREQTLQPIGSPQHSHHLGIGKNLGYGSKVKAVVEGNQGDYRLPTGDETLTSTQGRLELSLDLWKNFLGKLDRAESRSLAIGNELARLQGKLRRNQFLANLRKIYWRINSVDDAMQFSRRLLESSEVLLATTKRRFKRYDADQGDIARLAALVNNRQAVLHQLETQREASLTQLRYLVPSYASNKIRVEPLNLNTLVPKLIDCVRVIKSQGRNPLFYTTHKELLDLVEERAAADLEVAGGHDRATVELYSNAFATGQDDNYGDAFSDTTTERSGYSVGLRLASPLGGTSKASRKLRILNIKSAAAIEKAELETAVAARQSFYSNQVDHLLRLYISQRLERDQLAKSLASSYKKFRQGRTTVQDLIAEQDRFVSTSLTIIEFRTQVIELILDYLEVFNKTQCQFNRKA